MSRRRGRFFSGDCAAALLLGPNPNRPSWIGWPAEADTPSWGKFAKEPLSSLDFEPAVQSVFQRIRFLFWKTYFSFSRFKIKFHIFTELPLISNAYKMLILTPI